MCLTRGSHSYTFSLEDGQLSWSVANEGLRNCSDHMIQCLVLSLMLPISSRLHAALASEIFCPQLTPHVCYLVLPHLMTLDFPLTPLLAYLSDVLPTGGLQPSLQLLYSITQLVNPKLGEEQKQLQTHCVPSLLRSPPPPPPFPFPSSPSLLPFPSSPSLLPFPSLPSLPPPPPSTPASSHPVIFPQVPCLRPRSHSTYVCWQYC